MTCEQLRGEYELLALGILDRSERAELDEHLTRGCGECTKALRRAYVTNAYIMTMAPNVPMPRSLRKRIAASVAAERRKWSWISAVGAVLASMVVVFGWLGMEERQKSQGIVTFIKASDTKQYAFPRGRVFVNPSRGILLLASNLPELNTGKTFELWVIPKGGTPKPAGLFASSGHGSAAHMYSGPLDVERTAAVAVSIEPASGSPAPTTTPILVVPLSD